MNSYLEKAITELMIVNEKLIEADEELQELVRK
jgi:hypothetical protein